MGRRYHPFRHAESSTQRAGLSTANGCRQFFSARFLRTASAGRCTSSRNVASGGSQKSGMSPWKKSLSQSRWQPTRERNRSLHFADLVSAAAKLDVPENPPLKEKPTLIGQSLPRKDIPCKVNGSAKFGIDVRVPDMVYAAIRHAPVFGAEVASVDRSALNGMKGIIEVVEIPSAVLVVADTFWHAKKGVDALEITFKETEFDAIGTADIIAAHRMHNWTVMTAVWRSMKVTRGRRLQPRGSLAGKVVSADYTVPFLYHARWSR